MWKLFKTRSDLELQSCAKLWLCFEANQARFAANVLIIFTPCCSLSFYFSRWSPQWVEGTCRGASSTDWRRCIMHSLAQLGHLKQPRSPAFWWTMSLSCWIRLYSMAVNCPHWRSCRRDWRHQPGLPPEFDVVHVLCNRLVKTEHHGQWDQCDACSVYVRRYTSMQN